MKRIRGLTLCFAAAMAAWGCSANSNEPTSTGVEQAQLDGKWTQSLQAALRGATRLRVRSGGTCHRDEPREQTLLETSDAATIKQLLAGIAINEQRSGFHCMCCGNPSLEFYKGDRLLLTLGFHHGQGLRWVDGWPGDAALTRPSADFLVAWLATHNVAGPLRERDAEAEQAQALERKIAQATSGLSPSLAKAFRSNPAGFHRALARESPDTSTQIDVWLRIFGASNGSWTQLESVESAADKQLRTYNQKALVTAVERALLGDDRQLRRGAARLWMSWRSPLEAWKPPNVAKLHEIVLTIEQEARYYPLRMEALRDLAGWREELTEVSLNQRLAAGLQDPAPQVRRKALLIAGQIKHADSIPALMRVLSGVPLPTQPLPEVPAWEAQDVPDGFGDVCPGSSDVEVAALALAEMQHLPAKPLIEAIQPPTASVDIALALLGEGQRLKAEHFATPDSNQELQLAAVRVVTRSKGKFGLKLALGYQQATHWWEEEHVAKELSQMLLAQGAPGSQKLVNCKSLKTLNQWFTDYGADYVNRANMTHRANVSTCTF